MIDDELTPGITEPSGNYMWYYARAFHDRSDDFEVTEMTSADEALRELSTNASRFHLIVLDIMMPPGETFVNADTFGGLRTGVLIAEHARQFAPNLPIVVLTNVLNARTLQQLHSKPNVKEILAKPDYAPFAVVEKVLQILGE
jgi:CheY-like chemotaxis protein